MDPNNLRPGAVGGRLRPGSQYFVLNYIYELPFGPGKPLGEGGHPGARDRALAGERASTTFGRRHPGGDHGTRTTPPRLPGRGRERQPARTIAGAGERISRIIDRWFDTTAYAAAAPYTLANGSRTEPNLRNPGIANWDIGLSRAQRIRERLSVQFRAEFFSAFNTPQFGEPGGSVVSATFGKITGASGTRNIQMGLRVSW